MPNSAAAALIADRLQTGLQHPGDTQNPAFTLSLPAMRSNGLPQEMAAQWAAEAGLPSHETPKLLSEALIHELEQGGYTVIPTADLEQLRQDAADAPDGTRVVHVVDARDRQTVLFLLTIGKDDKAYIDGGVLERSA
jgi:hypothetical protein